jgi:hypothetical protein
MQGACLTRKKLPKPRAQVRFLPGAFGSCDGYERIERRCYGSAGVIPRQTVSLCDPGGREGATSGRLPLE